MTGKRAWPNGLRYAKVGVILTELLPEAVSQPALWAEVDRERRAKLFAPDAVLEFPFAPAGVPRKVAGREALLAHMRHFRDVQR